MTDTCLQKASKSEWTDWHIAEMRRRAAEGESAKQVAECCNFSRAAVLGKANRLGIQFNSLGQAELRKTNRELRAKGLPVRKESAPRAPRERRVKISAPAFVPVPVQPEPAPQHIGPLVSIMDLKEGVCRYPIGDPGTDEFGYCGALALQAPYCCAHRLIAYTGKAPRTLPRPFKLRFLGTMMHEAAE